MPTSSDTATASAGLIAGLVILFLIIIGVAVAGGIFYYIKKYKKVDPHGDKLDLDLNEKNRHLDTVTPSVVNAEMLSPKGASHGKLNQVLGPEFTMSNATDESKATHSDVAEMSLEELETARKLPPIETGNTPRDAMSPLDTQLLKPTLPAIH